MANNTIFDDVFRTLLEKMPELAVPLINEVFGTSYPEDILLIQKRNEHQTKQGEIITDSYFLIADKAYHIECQSTSDSSMIIRMIEYDFSISLESLQLEDGKYRMYFPNSCILFLRGNADRKMLGVEIVMPDGSQEYLDAYPGVRVLKMDRNYGFCGAVNAGIKAAVSDYVILLNNDTEVDQNFAKELLKAIKADERIFSCSSKMVQYHDRSRMDDAGDYYCALGWAFGRGKGGLVENYDTPVSIFASCAGAAVYRKKMLESLGYFDESHFAYLEDIDIGYRANTGDVSCDGDSEVGGIVGWAEEGAIESSDQDSWVHDCYNTGSVSESGGEAAGIIGYSDRYCYLLRLVNYGKADYTLLVTEVE